MVNAEQEPPSCGSPESPSLGTHLILELRKCNTKLIGNLEFVQNALKQAALEAQATIVEVAFHEFSPFGISGMVVIAESHLAIHTWPEYGYAAVDVFTCGNLIDPAVAAKYLIKMFESQDHSIITLKRGTLDNDGPLLHKPLNANITTAVHQATAQTQLALHYC